ncbi:chemotaxis protein CheX [Acetoanaerobium noterae]|uniref:Chemotaxis protein CheX n=1 Tax=Acetoanaerobium noterae TaxID=745369 RepID=A0A1T4ZS73_9FIRM|nr:chemotaxis protein CheX [Acetoanaerobium noterae]MBP9562321.1 chemotaxis protein CheX [Acetoanaerobium sp.]SKB25602.1 chemotaxis protein CheX [Acetoanaerobium noterae]
MDVRLINPFIGAVTGIMPQIGFSNITRKGISLKEKKFMVSGVVLTLGIVGDKKGNVVYSIDMDGAKKIASTMMMGMPVEELDDMSKSALSELSNMLTANASINFSNDGINVDISVPTMMYGEEIEINLQKDNIVCIDFDVDGIVLSVNVALD